MRPNARNSLAVFFAALIALTLAAGRAKFGPAARSGSDAGETVQSSGSLPGRSLSDLKAPAVAILQNLPGVEAVEVLVAAERPAHRIVQIADWHFVSRDAFAADIRDQADEAISDDELDRLYAEHLDEVRRVQLQQRRLLRELIRRRGVVRVFCEGLTDSDMPVYEIIIEHFRRRGLEERELRPGAETVDDAALRIGSAGQLLAAGELAEVLPSEDESVYEQANPLTGDGQLRFDSRANGARQVAIVRRLLDSGSLAVVILGGDHDLSEQVRQLGGGRCEYVRVKVSGMPVAGHASD